MIDFSKEIVSALKTILPVYHELHLTANTKTPCISYQQRDNAMQEHGDTIGYNRISYTVKVWGNDIAVLQDYSEQIDNVMRLLGFKRISSNELYDYQSTMIQKIMAYEAYVLEEY